MENFSKQMSANDLLNFVENNAITCDNCGDSVILIPVKWHYEIQNSENPVKVELLFKCQCGKEFIMVIEKNGE